MSLVNKMCRDRQYNFIRESGEGTGASSSGQMPTDEQRYDSVGLADHLAASARANKYIEDADAEDAAR